MNVISIKNIPNNITLYKSYTVIGVHKNIEKDCENIFHIYNDLGKLNSYDRKYFIDTIEYRNSQIDILIND